ncbi:MAG: rhomboid family intramembrane serine protease [Nitrososphaerales archaeon]
MSSVWRNVRPAWLLALVILLGWVIGLFGELFSVCPPSIQNSCTQATNYLAQNNGLVVFEHQYYQIFTSTLVTPSALDAGFNAIAVLVLDRLTEDSLNKTRYFLVFFSTAALGNILTLLQGPNYASAGASGGIFGIFAALIIFSWLKDKKVDQPSLVLFIVIFFGSSILPDVNYVAHIGGAIGGFIAGALLYVAVKPTITEYSFAYVSNPKTVVAVAVLILLLVAASIAQFAFFTGL